MGETEGVYATRHRETIAEAPNLRLALGEGQCVPWHYHNNITDTFFCMEGPMQVTTRDPEQVHVLAPGGTIRRGAGSSAPRCRCRRSAM
jgi:quercetin dioxygenase-like cupin family protein